LNEQTGLKSNLFNTFEAMWVTDGSRYRVAQKLLYRRKKLNISPIFWTKRLILLALIMECSWIIFIRETSIKLFGHITIALNKEIEAFITFEKKCLYCRECVNKTSNKKKKTTPFSSIKAWCIFLHRQLEPRWEREKIMLCSAIFTK
jgi:hypothetical protein